MTFGLGLIHIAAVEFRCVFHGCLHVFSMLAIVKAGRDIALAVYFNTVFFSVFTFQLLHEVLIGHESHAWEGNGREFIN